MTSVEVGIFGRIFRLRTNDPALTMSIAAQLDQQLHDLKERYEILDFSKLLLLVALQQQESLSGLQAENTDLRKDLERMNQMISKIIGEI